MLIQYLLIPFVLFALSRVVVRAKAHEITTREFLFWFLFWLCAAVVIAWPNSLNRFADLLGVGRGVDVVLYAALVVLFYVVFRIFTRIERIERDITFLVRRKALEENDHDKR